jgi:hypothetical protein
LKGNRQILADSEFGGQARWFLEAFIKIAEGRIPEVRENEWLDRTAVS